MLPAAHSLLDVLRQAAAARGSQVVYRFLVTGDASGPQETLTALQLEDSASCAAANLLQRGVRSGDRVAVVCTSPIDFARAFFGCLWAGAIAVPVVPPRGSSGQPVLRAILENAQPAAVIGDAASLAVLRSLAPGCALLDCSKLWNGERGAEPAETDTAFLQYTSGSTSAPRGVIVSHAMILASLRAIHSAVGAPVGTRGVCWLPLSHDLGLIGSLLLSLFAGCEMVLLTPQAFAESPVRWLRAISEFRAWGTSAPNFALALCTRMIRKSQLDGLDLSCLESLLCGAEPIDAAALEQFAYRFGPYGLRRECLRPCYGLAETTLMVSMTPRAGLRTRPGVRPAVSCGSAQASDEIAIVDPESGRRVVDGESGEIWFSGSAVAEGYYGWSPSCNDAVFRARLEGSPRTYLRTGDLGAMIDGELYVTGRLKDSIIVRGVNYDAHDLERAAAAAHPDLSGVRIAAFGDSTAGVVLMVEAVPGLRAEAHARLVQRIRARLDVQPDEIVVVLPKSIAVTTSGKLRRAETARLYREGAFDVVYREPSVADDLAVKTVLQEIRRAARLGDRDRIPPGTHLSELGIDSLGMVQLSTALDVAIDDDPTIEALLERVRCPNTQSKEQHSDIFAPVRAFAEWLQSAGEHPFYRPFTDWEGVHATLDGRRILILSAFDYLGLGNEPRVREAAARAACESGTSRSGARVHAGTSPEVLELEAKLARFVGREDAVVCTTGYQAVAGLVTAFMHSGTTLVVDEAVHASVLDGAAIARCRLVRFRHNDAANLDSVLAGIGGAAMVLIEGLYSNTGDLAPLRDIAEVCRNRRARLALDDAHGLGVLGASGRGAEEHHGCIGTCDLLAGTFSKSLASTGGWIAGTREAMEYVRYHARTVLFTAGIAPPALAAASAAMDMLIEQPQRAGFLRRNSDLLRGELERLGVAFGGSCGPILRIPMAGEERCVGVVTELLRRGVYVNPVLYPSVSRGNEMLRLCVSAAHDPEDLRAAAALLAEVIGQTR